MMAAEELTEHPRWLSAGEQGSWRSLVAGTTLLMHRLDEDLRRESGIALTEYEILVRLSESEDRRMRMARLAASLYLSRSRITHTVARMEQQGLVERIASDDDGRGVDAHLTPSGHTRLAQAAPGHVESVRRYLVDMVPEDDFAATGRVLAAVADRLASDDPDDPDDAGY